MRDPLDDVLRLVAEGRLSAEEAAPIIDALAAARGAEDRARAAARLPARQRGGPAPRRQAGRGRPASHHPGPRDGCACRSATAAARPSTSSCRASSPSWRERCPGIPAAYADRVREAIRTGLRGPIIDVVDDDGSGVTITLD